MNDDKRLQGECPIYINCKGTWIPSMKGCINVSETMGYFIKPWLFHFVF